MNTRLKELHKQLLPGGHKMVKVVGQGVALKVEGTAETIVDTSGTKTILKMKDKNLKVRAEKTKKLKTRSV